MTNNNSPCFFALLVNKPIGITSHTLTHRIAKITGLKAGHTGTLDKAASGLMIILLGSATKFSRFFLSLDKEYSTIFKLGIATNTLDSAGVVTKTMNIPLKDEFMQAFNAYKGVQIQKPPEYSAVHIQGQRAWQRAKKNEAMNMPARTVTIYSSKILSYQKDTIECLFKVSSGTYIRSLVQDITAQCNSCGHLAALHRTKIHTFDISSAISLDEIISDKYHDALIPADELLQKAIHVTRVQISDNEVRKNLVYGTMPKVLADYKASQSPILLYDKAGFLGMWEYVNDRWKTVVHC